MGNSGWNIRKARIGDASAIHRLVNGYASAGEMLGRSRSEIYEGIRDFFVAEMDDRIVGCSALHVNWEDLAEVRSLAVEEDYQGHGVGGGLVASCLKEAVEIGISRVYALTYRPEFFEKLGFTRVPKESLPQKIWADCLKCPQFPNCDEHAVIKELN
ncbi:MAG: N-acetyltransferase [Deltaproteobacteria bacterium]|nr:N-acetyltransferase [Deltaproteobacteria bacterium]